MFIPDTSPVILAASVAPGVLHARYSREEETINVEPSPTGSLNTSSPIAVEDWNDLLDAVKDRLRSTVSERSDATHPLTPDDIRTRVLECIDALDQLHTAQKEAHRHSQRQELQAFEAQTELTQLASSKSMTFTDT